MPHEREVIAAEFRAAARLFRDRERDDPDDTHVGLDVINLRFRLDLLVIRAVRIGCLTEVPGLRDRVDYYASLPSYREGPPRPIAEKMVHDWWQEGGLFLELVGGLSAPRSEGFIDGMLRPLLPAALKPVEEIAPDWDFFEVGERYRFRTGQRRSAEARELLASLVAGAAPLRATRTRPVIEWRRIFGRNGKPMPPRTWTDFRKRELAAFDDDPSKPKSMRLRLPCVLLPPDYDDSKAY